MFKWLILLLLGANLAQAQVPVVIDSASQRVLDLAWIWSKEFRVETGGCFVIQRITTKVDGTRVFVFDAKQAYVWRRPDRILIGPCASGEGVWHTHWPSQFPWIPCEPSYEDYIWLNSPAGLVICGLGAKNTYFFYQRK